MLFHLCDVIKWA
uniref:Uncharacterized protein n=1 Tax=Arundo donax TaxID=35708 RepID=A0A0A9BGH4_ARUDO